MKPYLLSPGELEGLGIHTVIVASPDLQGRLIGRRVPVERFEAVARDGVEVCSCAWAWDIQQSLELIEANSLALCSMHNGLPDVKLMPDLGTLRRAAWLEGIAICLADPVDPRTDEPMSISPRVLLKKELARYAERELVPQVGTELEFYLFLNDPRELRKNGFRGLEPSTLVSSDFMIHEGNGYEPFFRTLRANLRDSGIEMEAAQSEWGLGQWEMTFVYGDPLEMADRHSLYKLAVRDSAAAAGMSVTFMARPVNDQPGSSCHVHFSLLNPAGDPVFWDEAAEHHMSRTMHHAIAGVLEHTPALMAWYAPTINSYRRVNSAEVAGYGRTWGHDNRSVSLRRVGFVPSTLRFEFRLPGADTNPYLTLTGLLASVRDGIDTALEPPAPTTGNAYELPKDEGMPTHLAEAARLFGGDGFVLALIGATDADHFRILAEHEWDRYQSTVSDWDLERYFDRI